MNAKQSILKHVGLAGVLKGYGIYDNVITAMEDYAQERVKNCSIPAVSGSLLSDGQIITKRKELQNDGTPRTENEYAIALRCC